MISNLLLVSLSMNLCENKTRGASHKTAKDKMILTEHEEALILAYRSKEIYRKAIDKLLDL